MLRLLCLLPVLTAAVAAAAPLPPGFVRLGDVDPTIEEDIRYFGPHNFLGRPVAGYEAPECILTRPAAEALRAVQAELAKSRLSLKVYDCYRPQRAVDDFIAWSGDAADQAMKAEFYPRVDKARFFALGYVAAKSGHSRGSTVDLAIVPAGHPLARAYVPGEPLADCALPAADRFPEPSLDFGTGFDCMDPKSHHDAPGLPAAARANRGLLRGLMERNGFAPYAGEWWHYTLRNEPFPKTFFDFPVTARP